MAKGFGGNYFNLQAITATVSNTKIAAVKSAVFQRHLSTTPNFADEETDDPPAEHLELLLAEEPCFKKRNRSSHHCNCIFKKRTSRVLCAHIMTPNKQYHCHKRRSGLAPPTTLSHHTMKRTDLLLHPALAPAAFSTSGFLQKYLQERYLTRSYY